ncbi:tripartite motif-containing protein 16-like [Pempheris klunzingeri]|uniref:tripartite motif-containing protein 16-like n=1 Tax=Pempheris klunzingeri TaxID=3127111 RepID=UPI0039800497
MAGKERNHRPCSGPECGDTLPSRPQPIMDTALADLMRGTVRRDAGSKKRKRQHSGVFTRSLKGALSRTETGTSGGALCRRHGSPLDVYCCSEKQIICAVCASAEHKGHTIGLVRGERRRRQKELKSFQAKSVQILQKRKKKKRNLEGMLEQILEEVRQTQDYCESVLASVIDSIQRHYLSVRELIRAQAEAATTQVQISLQSLKAKMEEMRKRSAELDHLAQTDNNIHFLEKWPSLRRLCKEDHLHPFQEVSEDLLLNFELTKRGVEQLGRQMEEFCDKEFASICHTAEDGEQQESGGETDKDDMQQICEASSSQHCKTPFGFPGVNDTEAERNVEPETRAEFLQYACDLSLDPATAHEDLVISPADKEVRLSPHSCDSPAVRSPQRFIHRRHVLCREGLQADRCYYEIEVKGGKAEIALTYKGIDRKSRTVLSAFGGNAKSWSLDRSTTYSVSHKAESIQLTTTPSHDRIGVYLKFREGTLSFYEVSDRMKFLYKVEAVFTEPLYPGFWLGEKCSIRICDLGRDRHHH